MMIDNQIKNVQNNSGSNGTRQAKKSSSSSSSEKINHSIEKANNWLTSLPKWETALCWIITLATIGSGFFALWRVSSKWRILLAQHGSVVELPLIGKRAKDESDFQWHRWNHFVHQYAPFLLLHSIVFNILPIVFANQKIWIPLYTFLSMAACSYIFTLHLVVVSVMQGLFTFLCTITFKRVWAVWLSVVPLFYLLLKRTDLLADDRFLVFMFVPYTLVSYISFCLELTRKMNMNNINQSNSKCQSTKFLLIRMLFYVFYQPYLCAIVVLYPDFESQMAQRMVQSRQWKNILYKALRLVFWWTMCELILHFFYFGAISQNPAFMRKLPFDEFLSSCLAMGAFFHMKHVVIYGLPTAFALLDGMRPVDGPICVFRISQFSKLWRGFDRGMHAFFKEYIYRPICGQNFSLPTKIFGIYAIFFINAICHGFHHNKIVWILLNIIGLNIEFGAKAFYSFPIVISIRERFLSNRCFRRLLAFLHIIPFFLGIFSNLYFLGGSAIGWLVVYRICWEEAFPPSWTFLLICTLAYFHNQIVMEAEVYWPTTPAVQINSSSPQYSIASFDAIKNNEKKEE